MFLVQLAASQYYNIHSTLKLHDKVQLSIAAVWLLVVWMHNVASEITEALIGPNREFNKQIYPENKLDSWHNKYEIWKILPSNTNQFRELKPIWFSAVWDSKFLWMCLWIWWMDGWSSVSQCVVGWVYSIALWVNVWWQLGNSQPASSSPRGCSD